MLKNKINSKWVKPFKNVFVLTLIAFTIWMLFFDNNSWLIHRELNNEIESLNAEKNYYLKEIEKDKKTIQKLKSENGLEKFAREAYYMKREKEEIFIIEYEDSLKTSN